MKRILAAVLTVALAVAASFFEAAPQGTPVRELSSEWLAANAVPPRLETIAAIELPPDGAGMTALDAALILRAILRHEPKAIAFLVPIEAGGEGGEGALLVSKLDDVKIPVVFTSNDSLEPMPGIAGAGALPPLPALAALVPAGFARGSFGDVAAGQVSVLTRLGKAAVASNVLKFCMTVEDTAPAGATGAIPGTIQVGSMSVPVDGVGCATINPLAGHCVQQISFAQLVLQTERSEQGSISAVLDGKFRGRLVAVQKSGRKQAAGVAALRNGLADSSPSPVFVVVAVLLAATLPWWGAARSQRVALAIVASCAWMLMALALYSEFRMETPLLVALLLPVLALIPSRGKSRSDEVQQRELPA